MRTTFPSLHPNFYDFVEKLSEITDRSEHKFNVERVNPKRMKEKALTTNAKPKQLIDVFNAHDVLTLELPELLDRIGSLLSESSRFESSFEGARENEFEFVDADFCARGEVPMELDDDGWFVQLIVIYKIETNKRNDGSNVLEYGEIEQTIMEQMNGGEENGEQKIHETNAREQKSVLGQDVL